MGAVLRPKYSPEWVSAGAGLAEVAACFERGGQRHKGTLNRTHSYSEHKSVWEMIYHFSLKSD